MTQRPYSSYLSKRSDSQYERSSTPNTARIRHMYSTSLQEDKAVGVPSRTYRSSYLKSDEAREETRQSSFIQHLQNTERRTVQSSSPSRAYDRFDKFSSAASINTNILHEAIDNVLDGEKPDVSSRMNIMTSESRNEGYRSSTYNRSNYGSSNIEEKPPTNNDSNTNVSPVGELIPKPPTRPISPLDDRTISNNDFKFQSTSQYDRVDRSNVRYSSNSRNELRSSSNRNYGRERDDPSTYSRRYSNSQSPHRPYSSQSRRSERQSHGRSEYGGGGGGGDNETAYLSRRHDYDDRSHFDNSPRNRNYRGSGRGRHDDRREDRYARRRDDDYRSVERRRDDSSIRHDSLDEKRFRSQPRSDASRYHYNRPGSRESTRSGTSLMTFEFVNDGGNIKLRSKGGNLNSDDASRADTLYEFNANEMVKRNNIRQKEEKQGPIVINVHPNPQVPFQQTYGAGQMSTNYDAMQAVGDVGQQLYVGDSVLRSGLPPRLPMQNNITRTFGNAPNTADVSSAIGFQKSFHSAKNTASILSSASAVSKWKNHDVVLLPKGEVRSEAAIAATAAANLIVDMGKSSDAFETAVKSVSNMLKRNEEGNDDAALVVRPSISHGHFYGLADDSVVPISFHKVTENMNENMRMKASQKRLSETNLLQPAIDSTDFFARCAMLAATAIMKADPDDKAVIAQTATETILSFHVNARVDDDWLNAAENDLKHVANEVSNAINSLPVANSQAMASLAAVTVLSEGGKSIALERVRQRVQPNVEVEVLESQEQSKKETKIDDDDDDKDFVDPRLNIDEGNDDGKDFMAPIRSKGSLMDNFDSDDSSANSGDEKEVKLPQRPNRIPFVNGQNPNPIPLNTGVLKTQTESAEKDQQQPLHQDSKEEMRNAVKQLLPSSSEDIMESRQYPTSEKKSALDKKQYDIAKRIQRIQMRASGKTDEEIDELLGTKKGTFSGDDVMQSGAPNRKNKEINKMSSGKKYASNNVEDSDLPSVKEVLDGIGTMIAPVASYIGGLNVPSTDNMTVSSMMEKIKKTALPDCRMDDLDVKFDEDSEFNVPVNKKMIGRTKKHGGNSKKHGSERQNSIPKNPGSNMSPQQGGSNMSPQQGGSNMSPQGDGSNFDPQGTVIVTSNSPASSITMNMRGPSTQQMSNSPRNSLMKSGASDSGGAFSAALNNNDFPNIPIQLSMTPSGVGNLDTMVNGAFSVQTQGATETYRSKHGFERESIGPTNGMYPIATTTRPEEMQENGTKTKKKKKSKRRGFLSRDRGKKSD